MNINYIKHRWSPVGLVAALAMMPAMTLAAQPGKSPVKVFILAGQSNMEGQGAIKANAKNRNEGKGTLEYLVKDPATLPEFKGTVACVETRDFFRPQEDSPSNQGYHWNGNAETYFLIGDAMAAAMKKLCK